MRDLSAQIDPMEIELPAYEKSWYVSEKRDVLHLHVARDVAHFRIRDAFRGEMTDKKGLVFAKTTISGSMMGDMLDIQYVSRGRSSAKYVLKGRFLEDGPASQIVVSIRDSLLPKILLILPIAVLIPIVFTLVRGDRTSPSIDLSALGNPLALLAIFMSAAVLAVVLSGLVWLGSLWSRNVALDAVKNELARIISRPGV